MKERFLQEDVSVRLGELAANLVRTKSRCQNVANRDVVNSLIEDSLYLIEWINLDADVPTETQLSSLKTQLQYWQQNLSNIWADPTKRTNLAFEIRRSERVLNISGLLNEPAAS
ncbi:hypothetical protein F7734_12410 [Scytonema sp. UIC 10036]|uniref:hypothetical protein n=1 Tax=Scytonema sp. UIC 10036 TaxID=2304196 RepID=UPI0012DA0C75|nr:hypothetical protein [Scytonema sp. UIC 10036]MUG93189.1 hypothetical protein [Scytonema sp. UIC 10036]